MVLLCAASVFGEQRKLEPMAPENRARWKREIDWLLSVTDHIVEFAPSQQKSANGTSMEASVSFRSPQFVEFFRAIVELVHGLYIHFVFLYDRS